MKRVFTTFDTIVSVLILILGVYWLKEGISNQAWFAPASLIGGAAFFSLGFLILYSAVKSVRANRAMLRHATGGHRADKPVSSRHHGV
jgi:hypothetical protein